MCGDKVVEAVRQADKAGTDRPLGWPEPFVEFVTAHQRGKRERPTRTCLVGTGGAAWPTCLTDLAVRETTGQRPLSVAADHIGHTAMLMAPGCWPGLAAEGQPVDRTGTGVVVEVMPGIWPVSISSCRRQCRWSGR